MAVGINSVGYEEYIKELYDHVRIEVLSETTRVYCQHDKRIASNQVHAKKKERKKKRMMKKSAIIDQVWAKKV
jgi:hypothetical protein